MSDEKRLTVKMSWTTTKEFSVAVPTDTADMDIENILYDCDAEFLTYHTVWTNDPYPVDGEETMTILTEQESTIELQNIEYHEETANG